MKQLIDKYNRRLNYLRISITDRCNLRCKYCSPVPNLSLLSHDEILRYEEILRIVKIGVRLGITKVRVTGGEPLVRRGVYEFLGKLSAIDEIQDVSLTTNGVLLRDHIDQIKAAGIKRINVSLDSTRADSFAEITGRKHFDKVWQGLEMALDMGFDPVKINVVVLQGINDNELLDFARLTFQYPFHIRFIEYMPIGESHLELSQQLLTPQIKSIISTLGELVPVTSGETDGPAFRYRFVGAKGEIGFISPISQHFCGQCSRLRLTANGMLRTCLLSDHQIDMRSRLRNGCSDEEIAQIYLNAISHKQRKHHIGLAKNYLVSAPMSAIGG